MKRRKKDSYSAGASPRRWDCFPVCWALLVLLLAGNVVVWWPYFDRLDLPQEEELNHHQRSPRPPRDRSIQERPPFYRLPEDGSPPP